MRKLKLHAGFAWLLILGFFPLQAQQPAKKAEPGKKTIEPLSEIVNKHFAQWDKNHDETLELVEIDHAIENPGVHGRQAALIVSLRGYMTAKDRKPKLSHLELLKLVDEKDFAKKVDNNAKRLETIDRELFLPHDPNLKTFKQGGLSDCYLLSTIAAQINRNPKAIRDMIHPEVTGKFRVVFGDGRKVEVPALTDSELLLGAKLDDRHGSWLAVLEKAYGLIRKQEKVKKGDKAGKDAATVPLETLNFGASGPIISLLTGHESKSLMLNKVANNDEVHQLLVDVTKKKRLVCVGKDDKKAPPGIVNNHLYAVLGYDAQARRVSIFNPWGNNFKPKGNPGIEHGFETEDGHFKVPLDQFQKVFHDVIYETDKPLSNHSNP